MPDLPLPKKVWDLFPKWEYRCPECGTYVKCDCTKRCPLCKTPFNKKKWRGPPRFFKSREAMSDYAHKILIPRATPEQRALLTQFFTCWVTNEGFEDGTKGQFTGTQASSGDSVTFPAENPHCGSRSAKCYIDGSAVWEHAYLYYDPASSQTEVYTRGYFRIDTAPTTSDRVEIIEVQNITNGWISRGLIVDSTGPKWRLTLIDGAGSATDTSDSGPSLDTYYCVEHYAKIHAAQGAATLWVDDTEECALSGKDTNNKGEIDRILMGICNSNYDAATTLTLNLDCCYICDERIECEAPPTGQQLFTLINMMGY